jgi:predicted metal-dependent hydrolase
MMKDEGERTDLDSSIIPHPSSLLSGIELFNEHQFWHAHEAWERIWLRAEGAEKRFLQGLIQLAAAYHHVQRGTFGGGVRLFDAAFEKLSGHPEGFLGVERTEVVAHAQIHREKIARGEHIDEKDFPKFRYN